MPIWEEVVDDLFETIFVSDDALEYALRRHSSGQTLIRTLSSQRLDLRLLQLRMNANAQQVLPEFLLDLTKTYPNRKRQLAIVAEYISTLYRRQHDAFVDKMRSLIERASDEEFPAVNFDENSLEQATSLNPFLDLDGLIKFCQESRTAICRVRSGNQEGDDIGTGFLIADDLVLTCQHVVGMRTSFPGEIYLYFDYGRDLVKVDMEWGVFHSLASFANPDSNIVEASVDNLDFAVLKLENPVSGRLPVTIPGEARMPSVGEPILIAGHPGPDAPLQSLQFSMAAPGFVGLNTNEDRMIYKTSTRAGSSGSPVFDRNFRLIGLHRNRGNSSDSNQGVPLHKIVNSFFWKEKVAPLLTGLF